MQWSRDQWRTRPSWINTGWWTHAHRKWCFLAGSLVDACGWFPSPPPHLMSAKAVQVLKHMLKIPPPLFFLSLFLSLSPLLARRNQQTHPPPPLPGRYGEDFVEKRREKLQRWSNRIARHPVMSRSDVFSHFILCSDEGVSCRVT